ncbi:MAG: ATP-binding protein [bacterium]
MRSRRLLWRLFVSFIFITILSLFAALVFSAFAVRDFYYSQIVSDLESRARLIKPQLRELLREPVGEIDPLCNRLGQASQTRITLILSSGKVICDSEESPANMDNHADRPEIKEALDGRAGNITRYSHTLDKKMMYVAVPIKEQGSVIAAVRTSVPLASVADALLRFQGVVVIGGGVIAVIAALTSLMVSRRISRPLEELKKGAKRFSEGELDTRLPEDDLEEIGSLAHAMNEMAAELGERFRTITSQRNEQEAILGSMREGVIAISTDETIISLNQAARLMLGITSGDKRGRSLQEVVRDKELQSQAQRALSNGEEDLENIEIEPGNQRIIQAHATAVRDENHVLKGAVLVLNDVTQLRRLENMRRDFVANVTHELRTPITSIKGFVETLQGGALDSRADAERFLEIIHRQVEQLNSIVEDLLLLSRLEETQSRDSIRLEYTNIRNLLESALELCTGKAATKDVSIGVYCADTLRAKVNPPLLSQAVTNLLENAINYSESGSSVNLTARQSDTEFEIMVQDQGQGIEEKHLGRIFERFYRVDKARSRKMGGTGVGLAIVKHIAQAHRGSVSVESTPGQGSTFILRLPL